MRRLSWLLLCVGFACSDDPSASVSGISPSAALTGRSTEVTISGYATHWSDDVTLDFGEGVTVDDVVVASPTAIVARITVAGEAAVGPRDVTVTGGGTVTYEQGFALEPPIEAEVEGTLAQGSAVTVIVHSRAFDITFDDTFTGDGFFTPIEYTNFTLDVGEGLKMVEGSLSVSPFEAQASFFVNVNVPAGPRDITIENGPPGAATTLLGSGGLEIAARAPTALTLGTPVTEMQEVAFGSQLYSVSPTAGFVVDVRVDASGGEASPAVAVLPSSGRWDQLVAFGGRDFFEPSSPDATFYLVYYDGSGAIDYSYTLNATEVMPAAMMDETAPEPDNDSRGMAQAASATPFRVVGALDGQEDQDWYSFEVAAADGGRTVTVGTYGGDATTDTVVEVFGPDGASLGMSEDLVYLDNLSAPTASGGGTHYVQIRHSTYPYDAANSHYRAIVKLD